MKNFGNWYVGVAVVVAIIIIAMSYITQMESNDIDFGMAPTSIAVFFIVIGPAIYMNLKNKKDKKNKK